MKITKNNDGSITIRVEGENLMPDGTRVPCVRENDVPHAQIFAHARDPEIYNALPEDVRAEVDKQRDAENEFLAQQGA